jgi:hypothetical protein
MAKLKIIRIELRGQPNGEVYKQLHSFMVDQNKWETSIIGNTGTTMILPSATYSGGNDIDALQLAIKLRDSIVQNIWSEGARVLVIDWAAWGEATTVPW